MRLKPGNARSSRRELCFWMKRVAIWIEKKGITGADRKIFQSQDQQGLADGRGIRVWVGNNLEWLWSSYHGWLGGVMCWWSWSGAWTIKLQQWCCQRHSHTWECTCGLKKGRLEASGMSAKEQSKTHPNMMCKYKMTSRKGHSSTSTWGNKDVVQPPSCKLRFQPRWAQLTTAMMAGFYVVFETQQGRIENNSGGVAGWKPGELVETWRQPKWNDFPGIQPGWMGFNIHNITTVAAWW